MEPRLALELFDREMRIGVAGGAGYVVERTGGVVRLVGGPRPCILYQSFGRGEVPAAVAEQAAYFRSLSSPVEWKLFSHDPEIGLAEALAAAGFRPDPPETLMVYDLSEPVPRPAPVPGLELRRVRDEGMIAEMERVDTEAFGERDPSVREHAEGRLESPEVGLFLAYLDGTAVAAGRVEMPTGRSFASLWGGGTVPAHRGRGIYRSLVSARADLARARGYRYLTVDARDTTSRPILERLGFITLTGIRGWILPAPEAAPQT